MFYIVTISHNGTHSSSHIKQPRTCQYIYIFTTAIVYFQVFNSRFQLTQKGTISQNVLHLACLLPAHCMGFLSHTKQRVIPSLIIRLLVMRDKTWKSHVRLSETTTDHRLYCLTLPIWHLHSIVKYFTLVSN